MVYYRPKRIRSLVRTSMERILSNLQRHLDTLIHCDGVESLRTLSGLRSRMY